MSEVARDVNATLQGPAVGDSIKAMGLVAFGFDEYVKHDSLTCGKLISRINLTLD